jgi:hypothetical protein
MAQVLERALDVALDHKDPKKKRERRLAKKEKSRPDEILGPKPVASRYIPAAVRERVHERGEYRCEFRATDGTRCTARAGLQIEHDRPFAIFRTHDERVLKILCARHNLFRAEQVYGTSFIRTRIEEARRARVRNRFMP